MTFLPIVARELRVASRRRATYWIRWAAALAALCWGIWIYAVTVRGAPKETGGVLFMTLTVLANLYALLAGLRTTADCLSEEKREGTLGLLFLTDLKGYDIVLGKLAATSLGAFYALLAMFPVLGISLMMGGVSPGEFGRVVLVSVNNLLFSLAVGMLCSAVSRDDRKAVAATFLIVLCATALPLLGLAIAEARNRSSLSLAFLLPSPGFTCFSAFDVSARATRLADAFWLSLGLVHGVTWLLLAAACLVVPHAWQDRPGAGGGGGLAARLRQWQYGAAEARLAARRRLLDLNPVLWLGSRERFKQAFVFLVLAGLGGGWIWGYREVGREWVEGAAIPFALAAHSVLKVWLSGESCRRFCEDRRSGALELLLATPLSVAEILRGQRWALWRQFAWPALAVLAADCLLMTAGALRLSSNDGWWIGLWLAGMAILVWDLHALSWVGPWMALNNRSPSRASSAALARICLLPWMIYGGGFAILGILEMVLRINLPGHAHAGGFIFAWFLLCAANNILFAGWAAHRLKTGFREAATHRFDRGSRLAEWGRLLGEWLRKKDIR